MPRTYRSLYRWDAWFSRPRFSIRHRDYNCSRSSMCQQIRNAASERGVLVSVEETRRSFVVTVTGRVDIIKEQACL
jgi:hypothetical protein